MHLSLQSGYQTILIIQLDKPTLRARHNHFQNKGTYHIIALHKSARGTDNALNPAGRQSNGKRQGFCGRATEPRGRACSGGRG
jgi:hypothetical protein